LKTLAIESTARAASVAICQDGKLIGQYFQSSGLTHSRTLLPMAEDLLKNLELTLSDIDRIAVANGPGSFTGVRIGVAAAKGLCWGQDIPACGVSTLEAMAWNAQFFDGVICPVMDARRSQVYNAKFQFVNGELIRLCPDRAISLEELIAETENDKKTCLLIGDGAEMCYNQMTERCSVKLAPENLRLQAAYGVARAAEKMEPTSAADITPNYLRLSQAERERLERERNSSDNSK
jgi:tRNA threonylcarbamoyladenosine biosynthesis protein TsaB